MWAKDLERKVSPLLEGPPTEWRCQVALWDPVARGQLRPKENRRAEPLWS